MHGIRRVGGFLLLGLVIPLARPPFVRAEDDLKYRDEMDKRLESADSELLDLQAARFRAIFAEKKDDEELERIDKEFKELQKERRELLRATGRMP